MTAVSISGIVKSYDGITKVLEGIDLEIGAGELFFLLGGSGCGKTTLLRLVAGFHAPDAGSICYGGQDILGLPPERRDIGMVFQNYALWPHLSVAENVAFGLEVRGVPAGERSRRVDEALALVELGGYGQRRIGALSGGQQQRVALARAIVVRPKVLLLDEPLSNLDARLRGEMRRTIRRVCKESGVTALYVTHDQAEALSTADRIALLAAGRVEQVGTPRELYERPRTELVARFLGDANILSAAQAVVLVPTVSGTSCLRPERIRFAAEGVPATVIEGSFQGDHAVWVVEVEGLGRLTVAESVPPDRQPGARVHVRVEAHDLVRLA